ncbi:hypothetical protein BIY24_14505 [Halobacteriovorax marinus]|uniref:hypothetical protein n=1 Tax=Halobacteriovorax marinus TaxID=97084 RepID=UPI000BC2D00A|nr:hypothetical protein [Halobacteriovorax marinus]ATH09110.1 hypothetical protein BIY24_14505 [Halobacteriovorax marinus]
MKLIDLMKNIDVLYPKPINDDGLYELVELKKKKNLIQQIEHMSSLSTHELTFRGEPYAEETVKNLLKERLGYIFCVGKKAKSFLNGTSDTYRPFEKQGKLDEDIKDLIRKSEKFLTSKRKTFENINGSFVEKCNDVLALGCEEKNKLRMLLLLFLHNKGNDPFFFKETSSFLSLSTDMDVSYGFTCCEREKTGVIYLYMMPLHESSHKYKTGKELKEELKILLDIDWFNDEHSEFILAGGMYPQKLLGLFIIENGEINKFILSPWAELALRGGFGFEDFYVNQEKFEEYVTKEKLTEFFCCNSFVSSTYIQKIGEMQGEKISDL